ncbi:hypothetical protein ACTXT7_001589, partial [Hymenolepis weldensis]
MLQHGCPVTLTDTSRALIADKDTSSQPSVDPSEVLETIKCLSEKVEFLSVKIDGSQHFDATSTSILFVPSSPALQNSAPVEILNPAAVEECRKVGRKEDCCSTSSFRTLES